MNKEFFKKVLKSEFYKKVWFAVLMIVILHPIGLVLIWLNKKLSKNLKIAISVVGGILFLYTLINDSDAPVIELKESTLTVEMGTVLTSEEIINDSVSQISDNRSDMSVDDISLVDYDEIDFTKKGLYRATLEATDEAQNTKERFVAIDVVKTKEQKAAEKSEKAAEKSEKENDEKYYDVDHATQEATTKFEIKAVTGGSMLTVGEDVYPGVYMVQITEGSLPSEKITESYATIGYSNIDGTNDYPANTALRGYTMQYVELDEGVIIFGSELNDVTFTPMSIEQLDELNAQ